MAEVRFSEIQREASNLSRQPLTVLEKKKGINSEYASISKAKFNQVKTQLASCKYTYAGLETRTLFLENLENVDRNNWPKPERADASLKEASRSLRKLKDEIADCRNNVEEGICKADEKYKEYEMKIEQLNKILADTEKQKQKLVELRTSYKEKQDVLISGVVSSSELQLLTEQQEGHARSIENALQKCIHTIENVKSSLTTFAKKASKLNKDFGKKQQLLNDTEALVLQRDNGTSDKIQWSLDAAEILQILSGIKEHSISENNLVLEILNPEESILCSNMQLLLEMNFKKDGHLNHRLESAKVNEGTLNIDDLVEHAVEINDMHTLINSVKLRWHLHVPKLQEVVKLRERFAIDWITEEQILRQMVGPDAHVVCTLQLPQTFPMSGETLLVNVEGINISEDLETLQPPKENPKLIDWLEYLEEKFGKP